MRRTIAVMLPSAARRMSLYCVLLANTGTRRLAVASPCRCLTAPPPTTFVRTFTPSTQSFGVGLRKHPATSSVACKLQRSLRWQRQTCIRFLHRAAPYRDRLTFRHELPVARSMQASLGSLKTGHKDATATPRIGLNSKADAVEAAAVTANTADDHRTKVTLLSGFLGAGKTTLMKNILREAKAKHLSLALIVNDMADVNVDAQLLAARDGAGATVRPVGAAASVAMQDGCICCTLRDDLLIEVEAIARAGKYQHLVIESTGISDPAPVAEALVMSEVSTDSGDGGSATAADVVSSGGREGIKGLFCLDTLVTVVDSTSFLDEVRKADDLEERGLEAQDGDSRTVADLLVAQVEFSNVILLNKADLVEEEEIASLEEVVRRLNSFARVLRTTSSGVALADVLGTGAFDPDEASQAAGWLQVVNHGDQNRPRDHPPLDSSGYPHERDNGLEFSRGAEGRKAARPKSVRRRAETFGVGSFTFRARRPFHPPRLMTFVMEHLPSVLRSKGYAWLATRHDGAGIWNQAGGSFAIEYGGLWDHDVNGDGSAAIHDEPGEDNAAPDKGRRNELVFIGLGMDESFLMEELRRCLLTREEAADGPAAWSAMLDPFPPWEKADA